MSVARLSLLAILLVAAGTIGGALLSEHFFGLVPCKLCLQQRYPYYVALPFGAVLLVLPSRWSRPGLAILAIVFAVSAALGAYHAGVEWALWAGPTDCGGGTGSAAAGMDEFMRQLGSVRVVSCTDAAWRFAGLSLAGWNALISAVLAAGAAGAALGAPGRRAP